MLAVGLASAALACREPAPPTVYVPPAEPTAVVRSPTPRRSAARTPTPPAGPAAARTATPSGRTERASATATPRPARTPTPAQRQGRASGPATATPDADDPCRAAQRSRTPPGPECAVKGNVGERGERIYHLPGMRFYDQTDIDPARGERWFRSAEEAERAGWRRSRQ